ncbi:MAG: AAA family ATPase [Lewinella sp.]
MDRINIQGYKSLADVTLDIKPINILIGGNGAGKSNFLSFFDLLKAYEEGRVSPFVEKRGGLNRFLFHGEKETDEISYRISFANSHATIGGSIAAGYGGSSEIVSTSVGLGRDQDKNAPFGFESEMKNGSVEEKGKEYLRSVSNYHFHDTGSSSPFSRSSHIENDIYFLYSDGSNIAAYLFHIQETNRKAYDRIVKNIQSIAPYFLDFFLQPIEGKFIRLQWRDKYSEYIYGVNDLSDGTIRFVALSVLFLQPKLPRVLIIDEPELGLHPVAIIKLAGLIKVAAAKGCKVIAATQSPALVDQFIAEDIVTVDNENGASRFRRLDESQLKLWLEDYSLGELWERNVIDKAQP